MRLGCLVLIGLCVAACDRQPVAPVAEERPQFDWMNNPDNGNLRIYRHEVGFRVCWTDPTNGLRVCAGTYPLAGEAECDLQAAIGPLEEQLVGIFDPADRWGSELHLLTKGDVWLVVRNTALSGDCFGNQLVAEGPGTFHNVDNDIAGTGEDEANANAWGRVVNGTLTTPEGDEVQFHGLIRWRYEIHAGFKLLTSMVRVH